MALIQTTTIRRKIVYFPPSVCHHSPVLLPADTMSAFQTAGKSLRLSTPEARLCQNTEHRDGPETMRVQVGGGGVCNMKQVRYKNWALMKTNISQIKSSRSSVISAKSSVVLAAGPRAPLGTAVSCDRCGTSASRFRSFPPPRIFWLSMKYWLGWLSEKLTSSTCRHTRRRFKTFKTSLDASSSTPSRTNKQTNPFAGTESTLTQCI